MPGRTLPPSVPGHSHIGLRADSCLSKPSSARLLLCFPPTEQSVFREVFPHLRPRDWARTWWQRSEFTTGLPIAGRRRLSGTSWPWTPSVDHSLPLLPL